MSDEHIIPDGIENAGILINNHEAVETLRSAIISAPRDINIMRKYFARILQNDAWRERLDPHTGSVHRCKTLQEFITAPMPQGLETDAVTIRSFLGDAPEAIVFEEVLALNTTKGGNNPEGRNQHAPKVVEDNIVIFNQTQAADPPKPKRTSPVGNSKAQAIGRLTRAAEGREEKKPIDPKVAQRLLDRIKSGELSPHRAMVEAGLRPQPTPYQAAQKAALKLTAAERAELLAWLSDLCREESQTQGA